MRFRKRAVEALLVGAVLIPGCGLNQRRTNTAYQPQTYTQPVAYMPTASDLQGRPFVDYLQQGQSQPQPQHIYNYNMLSPEERALIEQQTEMLQDLQFQQSMQFLQQSVQNFGQTTQNMLNTLQQGADVYKSGITGMTGAQLIQSQQQNRPK